MNIIKLNDTVKSFDFEPMPDREDSYIIGVVTEINESHCTITLTPTKVVRSGKTVDLTDDTFPTTCTTPMQGQLMMDWDNRLTVVS